jgi:pyruvate/2-oxoglutarate dehydrogenase complex dihydrolipoamide dehydrogenase (E3) component
MSVAVAVVDVHLVVGVDPVGGEWPSWGCISSKVMVSAAG